MRRFAARTGLSSAPSTPRRYLWTDAYALCNCLDLHRLTRDPEYLRLASMLVEQVHSILGHHRSDDVRRGWISGASEAEGAAHPTRGGLRIGKPLPERRVDEALDEHAEWDRDGQYFHYLTRWMHALARMARATGDPHPLRWAVELAQTACRRFTFASATTGRRFLHWKMSIDLTRPLVPALGHHDPLDGLITLLELRADVRAAPSMALPTLDAEIADLRAIWGDADCATEDALGIGGLLAGAGVLVGLLASGRADDDALLISLLRGAATGLQAFVAGPTMRQPPARRLAFRELGLAIGLQAVPGITTCMQASSQLARHSIGRQLLAAQSRHDLLSARIIDCWNDVANHAAASWRDHLDINEVMLASALLPPAPDR